MSFSRELKTTKADLEVCKATGRSPAKLLKFKNELVMRSGRAHYTAPTPGATASEIELCRLTGRKPSALVAFRKRLAAR